MESCLVCKNQFEIKIGESVCSSCDTVSNCIGDEDLPCRNSFKVCNSCITGFELNTITNTCSPIQCDN
eukprot:Pgem_evm1s17768